MNIDGLNLNPLPRKPGCTGAMGMEELQWMMRQAKNQIPLEVRVRDRLEEIHRELAEFSDSGGLIRTPDEWKQFRKIMRHGKRIATRFGVAEYKEMFSVLYATATRYLMGGGHM